MNGHYLILGVIAGLSIAAPIGPIGIICIRRTIVQSNISGLISGLGAATADGFYAVFAAFGLNIISDIFIGYLMPLRIIGGLFLMYLGIITCTSRLPGDAPMIVNSGLLTDYWTTLLLTLANPLTILSFASVCAVLDLSGPEEGFIPSAMMVLGIVTGSVLWWVLLVTGVSAVRSRSQPFFLERVNLVSGLMIFLFGIYTFATLFI